MHVSRHVPVSVAIHDSLGESPKFIENKDPKILVQRFVEELEKRRALIVDEVRRMYQIPDDSNAFKQGSRSLERVGGSGSSDWF